VRLRADGLTQQEVARAVRLRADGLTQQEGWLQVLLPPAAVDRWKLPDVPG
jgi:hypothetical protein